MHKRYEVIFNHNLQALMLTMDVKINEGWAPMGGICVVMEKLDHNSLPDPAGFDTPVFYQAIHR